MVFLEICGSIGSDILKRKMKNGPVPLRDQENNTRMNMIKPMDGRVFI
jgi:hypothetical protein